MIGTKFWRTLRNRTKNPSKPLAFVHAEVVSDIGCCRETNEDVACFIHPRDDSVVHSKGTLGIIADGMGGQPAGELASRIALDEIIQSYYDSPLPATTALRRAFERANAAIVTRSRGSGDSRGMGTTCTAIAILPAIAIFGHLGDTRLYLLRNGELKQLTEDQTRVMKMVQQGLITKDEARNHEDRNVILQALGQLGSVQNAQWGAEFATYDGDLFVLCSDGLYDLVRDDEIQESVLSQAPAAACRRLVDLAKCRGGFDNITVMAISVGTPEEITPRPKNRETHGDQEDEHEPADYRW